MRASFKTALFLCSFAFSAASLADDDDRRHSPRTKFENNAEHYKYEYRDGRCKYKYEYSYRSGKTKVEHKGDCRGIVMARPAVYGEPLPRAIPPGPQMGRFECNRDVLGAIVGGAVGAAVGSRVGEREDRVITTVGGAVIGAVVGGAIGRSMDEADQACAAQALEYAGPKQTVLWKNPSIGTSYTITSTDILSHGNGGECRNYVLRSSAGGQLKEQRGRACRQNTGAWVLVQ